MTGVAAVLAPCERVDPRGRDREHEDHVLLIDVRKAASLKKA
jgi:hypothetical protein